MTKVIGRFRGSGAAATVDALAEEILDDLACRFPVCLYSDEFHFFPQARARRHDWSVWDDFSDIGTDAVIAALPGWLDALDRAAPTADPVAAVDAAMLVRVLTTLRGQLGDVAFQRDQPTFHLTVAAMGLAEALEAGGAAWAGRLRGLPVFISRAVKTLRTVPRVFRDMGIAMAGMLADWLKTLDGADAPTAGGIRALGDMIDHLRGVSTREACLIDADLYGEVASAHVGCRLPIGDIRRILDNEIAETRARAEEAAGHLAPGEKWQRVAAALPVPDTAGGRTGARYRHVIDDLGRHCAAQEMMPAGMLGACPVRVAPVPAHLAPVRSSAAYSMPPGHPAAGGTFYTMAADGGLPPDWRLLAAHETYPGHHLLDASRWNHPRPVRRHLEFPLFYEGWASFSEELLFDTGFFTGRWEDRLLMAKRRFWRAMRGRAELDLFTGTRRISAAARFLADAGLDGARALAMARRYALKPGYQLCYTMGRTVFRTLYEQYRRRGGTPGAFAATVLAQGEVDFDHLARQLG